jgi:hypothetical protein
LSDTSLLTDVTLVFLVVNLSIGLLTILMKRMLTSAFLSVYRLDDLSLLFLYIAQGIIF